MPAHPSLALHLYTQPGCGLCTRLMNLVNQVLTQHPARLPSIKGLGAINLVQHDIGQDKSLFIAYKHRIPVLTYQDKIILEGNPSQTQVAQAIAKAITP